MTAQDRRRLRPLLEAERAEARGRERDAIAAVLDDVIGERDRREALLALYRVKLATDGLNGRPWNASVHLAAVEALAAVGEKALDLRSYDDFGIAQEMVECAVEAIEKLSASAHEGEGHE